MCLSLSNFSHSASCPHGPFMLSHVARCLLSWLSNIPLYVYMCKQHRLIHSSIHRDTGCFHILTIAKECKFLFDMVFVSLGYMPKSGTARSYSSISNFLRNLHNCFPQGLNQLRFPLIEGSLLFVFNYFSVLIKVLPMYPYPPIPPPHTYLPTLILCLSDAMYSNRCEVTSHYGFDSHYPDDY